MSTISFQPAGTPAAQTGPAEGIRRVFVRDLVLDCLIGVHRHERDGTQRVRINLDLSVRETAAPIDDRLANVLCYEDLIGKVRRLAAAGHVNLVETLAERIAALCLETSDVASVAVRVEKLDVFADAASVGIEIVRSN
jgi:dihydroneopterin aldolase